MVGMSTVVAPQHTGNRYLTYLPKYVLSTDDELRKSDDEIKTNFMQGVRQMLPDFDENSIESLHVNRAYKVQPLQVLEYSKIVPQVNTKHPNLYILNTSQFVNATLNNNEVVGAVEQFFKANRDRLCKEVRPDGDSNVG